MTSIFILLLVLSFTAVFAIGYMLGETQGDIKAMKAMSNERLVTLTDFANIMTLLSSGDIATAQEYLTDAFMSVPNDPGVDRIVPNVIKPEHNDEENTDR